jgi:hypothetical protein
MAIRRAGGWRSPKVTAFVARARNTSTDYRRAEYVPLTVEGEPGVCANYPGRPGC